LTQKSKPVIYICMYKRILSLELSQQESCFLWGPRQTGKSSLLKQLFPGAKYYDLLLSGEYQRLLRNPGILREECLGDDALRVEGAFGALALLGAELSDRLLEDLIRDRGRFHPGEACGRRRGEIHRDGYRPAP
jgi:hypothetical protein